MKRISKLLLLLISMCNISDVKALGKGDFYVSANYGIGVANKFNYNEPDFFAVKRPSNANVLNLAVGRAITDNVRTEISYYGFYGVRYHGDLNVSEKYNIFTAKQKQRSDTFFTSIYFDINKFSKIKPYFSAGIGVSRNKSGDVDVLYKGYDASYNLIKKVSELMNKSNTEVEFAWHISAGINYDISERITLNLMRYRFSDLGSMKTAADERNEFIREKCLKIHSISTGIIIKF